VIVEISVRERYSVVTAGATKKSTISKVAGSRKTSGAEYLLTRPLSPVAARC
jgi:hypothetical protein